MKGAYFNEIMSTIQIQESIGIAECVTTLQLLEHTIKIGHILERTGRTYKNAGKAKKIIPPGALADAIGRLRRISEPFIDGMTGGPANSDLKT